MSESNSSLSSDPVSKEQQLATLREWVAAARGKTYGKRDKRRYARLSYDNVEVTMELSEAQDWIMDAEPDTYTLRECWMTVKQFEDMPEFTGF